MTEGQEAHLENVKLLLDHWLDCKYRKGAKEHGDTLRKMTPLEAVEEAIQENIDGFVYLMQAREGLLSAKY